MKRNISRKEVRYLLLKEAKKEIILERRKRMAYSNFVDHILLENKNLLESKYLLQNEINEGIMDSIAEFGGGILGNLFPGFIAQWKQRLVTELLKSIGANTESKFAIALINILEEIEWTKIVYYFKNWSDGGCKDLIKAIVRGLQDSIQEAVVEDYFGLDVSAQGNIGGTFREAVTTTVNTELLPYLEEPISKFICNIPMGNILGNIKDLATGKMSVEDVFKGSVTKKATKAASGEVAKNASPAVKKLSDQLGE